ncbi:hypothetical protein [Mariniphaga sp.]|uniref:hypothetical protein n=1 Tax=Mariniphaga sp. TaxID=1954475 RepID=UPI003564BE4D
MKKKFGLFLFCFLVFIALSGCFGTRVISLDDSAISKKEQVLIHQNGKNYQLSNFVFRENDLTGDLMKSYLTDLPKSKKKKWLDVYVEPGFQLLDENESSRFVEIPNSAITKIEKTRFRAEYGLLIVPAWLVGGVAVYSLSSLRQQH